MPGSALFISLFGAVFVLGGLFMMRSRFERGEEARAFASWQARLREVAPIIDVEDDGHLYEWLDPPDWDQVFRTLERMPPDSRSLRQAMEAVAPGITK